MTRPLSEEEYAEVMRFGIHDEEQLVEHVRRMREGVLIVAASVVLVVLVVLLVVFL